MTYLKLATPLQGRLPVTVLDAVQWIRERGVPAYLVGGWIRDALLGRESRDLDLAVAGDPLVLARELARRLHGTCVPLHEAPPIARVVLAEEGRPWRLDIASLEGSLDQNLARRDFTVDAMALPLEKVAEPWSLSDVLDPLGGLEDLKRGLVRMVDPGAFKEDPVRLLRAVRLAAQLDFQVEAGTLQQVERDAPLLSGVAGERVRDELLKTLEASGTTRHLRLLDQVGLLCQVFPELEQGRGVQQPKEHYWDVLQHNIEAAGMVEHLLDRQGAALDPTLSVTPWLASLEGHFAEEECDGFSRGAFLKVSGLLHDLGKPATRSVETTGRIRFLGHQQVGATQAGEALRRLRVGGKGVRLVETSVLYHLRPGQLGQEGELPSRRAVFHYLRDVGDAALDTLYLNLADYLAARGPRGVEPGDWRHRCQSVSSVLRLYEEEAKAPSPKLVDGHLLMDALELAPGPLVGRLLDVVQEAQAAGDIVTQEEALALSRNVLAELKGEKSAAPHGAVSEGEGQEDQG